MAEVELSEAFSFLFCCFDEVPPLAISHLAHDRLTSWHVLRFLMLEQLGAKLQEKVGFSFSNMGALTKLLAVAIELF